jgi:hypothetical protein
LVGELTVFDGEELLRHAGPVFSRRYA